MVPIISSSTIFGLPMTDHTAIQHLCNPVILIDPVSDSALDDLLFDLSYCLENEMTIYNEDYSVTIIDSILNVAAS